MWCEMFHASHPYQGLKGAWYTEGRVETYRMMGSLSFSTSIQVQYFMRVDLPSQANRSKRRECGWSNKSKERGKRRREGGRERFFLINPTRRRNQYLMISYNTAAHEVHSIISYTKRRHGQEKKKRKETKKNTHLIPPRLLAPRWSLSRSEPSGSRSLVVPLRPGLGSVPDPPGSHASRHGRYSPALIPPARAPGHGCLLGVSAWSLVPSTAAAPGGLPAPGRSPRSLPAAKAAAASHRRRHVGVPVRHRRLAAAAGRRRFVAVGDGTGHGSSIIPAAFLADRPGAAPDAGRGGRRSCSRCCAGARPVDSRGASGAAACGGGRYRTLEARLLLGLLRRLPQDLWFVREVGREGRGKVGWDDEFPPWILDENCASVFVDKNRSAYAAEGVLMVTAYASVL